MGLLDSPYVGQLVKRGTLNKTMSASGWVGSDFDAAGYNTIVFLISISGTFDASSNISLRGNVTGSAFQIIEVYATKYGDFGVIDKKKNIAAGRYISSDLSNIGKLNFYYTKGSGQSNDVTITIDYYMVNTLNTDRTMMSKDDVLVAQETIACDDTGNHFYDGHGNLSGRKYFRIHLEFSADDSAVKLLLTSPWNNISNDPFYPVAIAADGTFTRDFTPYDRKKRKADYYVPNMGDRINIRVNTAGAAGLTCAVSIYATNYCPEPKHIQEITGKTITDTTAAPLTNVFTLDPDILSHFKFIYAFIGDGANATYNLSGSISKNWITNAVGDTETIITFSGVKNIITDWIPVAALSGKITFVTQGGSYSNYRIGIYGVV